MKTTTPVQGVAIEPVAFEVPKGTATRMTVKVLDFETTDVTTMTYWRLLTEEGLQLQQGNYTLTEEEFANWGENNNFVNKCVANAIGVVLI